MLDELYFAYRTNVSRIQQIQVDVYIYLKGGYKGKEIFYHQIVLYWTFYAGLEIDVE